MREILFRGKRSDNGQWVVGSLLDNNNMGIFHEDTEDEDCHIDIFSVRPETVCQYTGVFDKNEKMIFEWDIVKTKYGRLCVVRWHDYSPLFDLHAINTKENIDKRAPSKWDLWYPGNLEVIGNVFDNLELSKEDSNGRF